MPRGEPLNIGTISKDGLIDTGPSHGGKGLLLDKKIYARPVKARNSNVDVTILDINLRGSEVYPAAEMLRDRNIPIVFSTGYGAAGLDPV